MHLDFEASSAKARRFDFVFAARRDGAAGAPNRGR